MDEKTAVGWKKTPPTTAVDGVHENQPDGNAELERLYASGTNGLYIGSSTEIATIKWYALFSSTE